MSKFYEKVIYIKNTLNKYFIDPIVNIIICDYYICKYDCKVDDMYNYLMKIISKTDISRIVYDYSLFEKTFSKVKIERLEEFYKNIDTIYYCNYIENYEEVFSESNYKWCIFARCFNNVYFILTVDCIYREIFASPFSDDTVNRMDLSPADNIYHCVKYCFDGELNEWYCKNN